jgi:ABC-type sugar transport system ATPase subunit
MRSGEIEQVGSPMDIYLDPKSLFVADFFGSPSMNLVAGRAVSRGSDEMIETAMFSVPAGARLNGHQGDQLTVGVRPENVRLEPAGNGRGDGLPIALIEPLGRDTLVYLRTDGDKPFVSVASGMSTGHLKAGQKVVPIVDPADVYLFGSNGTRLV